MGDKQATRICGTCHKDVAEENFALHETHCRRFLCLCPDCDEPVPKEQLDQHREEQHTEVRCSKCHLKMERRHLLDHESDECEERLQSCPFCELELPSKDLDEHRLACGSRTELCRDCGRYVTLKDLPGHGAACSAANGGSGPPPTASKVVPPNKSKEMLDVKLQHKRSYRHVFSIKLRPCLGFFFTAKTTARCSRCMASFPVQDIEEHEMVCLLAARLDDEEAASEEEEVSEEEDYFTGQRATPWLSRCYQAGSQSDGPGRRTGVVAGDPDQISTCPHCHLALPVVTLRWHEVKCQIFINLR
ncbi:XIAP-associated factor 1 isoform X2 [Anarrhichthys ocellatus]|uniref:XIAP-associated factor 1 isoform X2 n=1 Tax=Anarrhichthys ocellatus TaxID=433405 RepID=UPI0012EE01FE|nr:XIAP-associated factor 1 isoform X2 [Anarrhichthys ocellatus]